MQVDQAIAKHGFRRWYERQLIESHAFLVTCVLCMIAAAGTVEAFFDLESTPARAGTVVGAFAAGAIALRAWSRYREIMARAEWMGDHATCSACQTYARFRVLGTTPRPAAAESGIAADVPTIAVECKQCGHRWEI